MAGFIDPDELNLETEEPSVDDLMVIFGVDREAAEAMLKNEPRAGCCREEHQEPAPST